MSEWQPIKTAPRDGKQIWAFDDNLDPAQFVAGFAWTGELSKDHPDYWEGWLFADEILINHCIDEPEPTHWMPLPIPPGGMS